MFAFHEPDVSLDAQQRGSASAVLRGHDVYAVCGPDGSRVQMHGNRVNLKRQGRIKGVMKHARRSLSLGAARCGHPMCSEQNCCAVSTHFRRGLAWHDASNEILKV